jgi:multiple sugar transport system ATP-binding protein
MGMGDRVAVFFRGKMRQLGTPEELYRAPADTVVATFLGSPPMNLVEQERSIIGFHPEHFLPTSVLESAQNPVVIPFFVTRVEYLGSERFLYGTVASVDGETRIVAKLPSLVTLPIEVNQCHEFIVQEKDLNYFDKSTGLRMNSRPLEG